jgi:hypothetical protein
MFSFWNGTAHYLWQQIKSKGLSTANINAERVSWITPPAQAACGLKLSNLLNAHVHGGTDQRTPPGPGCDGEGGGRETGNETLNSTPRELSPPSVVVP